MPNTLTPKQAEAARAELQRLLAQMEEQAASNRLGLYVPTPKQRDFHRWGATKRHRLLGAGNQSGKTLSGGMEFAMHMTGRYPDWWDGYVFPRSIVAWYSGVTGLSTRDNPQRILLGRGRQWGTGTIPKDALKGQPRMATHSVADLVDHFEVRHGGGGDVQQGLSVAYSKSYEMGREKYQGETLDLQWYDEEPPFDIYDEGNTRLVRRLGLSFITFTPLKGMTEVCELFYEPNPEDPAGKERKLIIMDIDDATFYTPEQRAIIIAGWPEHMRRARAHGLPIIGEGLVYEHADTSILVEPFKIPAHYRRIVGMDFGMAHPTAAVWLAHDPDSDVVYVIDEYKRIDADYSKHAGAIKARGDWIPVAWPHDGLKRMARDVGGAVPIADLYRQFGVSMLPMSARYVDDKGGAQSVEPVIGTINERMRVGTVKLFRGRTRELLKEKRNYYRKNGKPIDSGDDLLKALSYGIMMLRHARPENLNQMPAFADTTYDPFAKRN